ncbi:MAG: hypothetical protein HRT44_04460 [Bdellovibrionales bacterium]|nr:hypothetical protein [Bdellovibrionales bacterium]NQZ18496.1 hypothetical protein [Bdellovibrionales bacterium]
MAVFNVIHDLSSHYQLEARFPGVSLYDFWNQTKGEIDQRVQPLFTGNLNAPKFLIQIIKEKGQAPRFQTFHDDGTKLNPVGEPQDLECYRF